VHVRELNAATDAAVAAVPKPARTSENYDDEYIAYSNRADQVHRAALRDFQRAHLERYRDLERRYHTIRETLQAVAEKQQDPHTGKPLTAETLLRRHAASLEEFNTFGRDATMLHPLPACDAAAGLVAAAAAAAVQLPHRRSFAASAMRRTDADAPDDPAESRAVRPGTPVCFGIAPLPRRRTLLR